MAGKLFDRRVSLEFIDRDNQTDILAIDNPEIYDQEPIHITFQVSKQLSTEPNTAYIEIYNLSDSSAARINFRKPVIGLEVPVAVKDKTLLFKFGKRVNLYAGYGAEAGRIFSGVVVSAITSFEGPVKVTRIECRNVFYELMQQRVKKTFAKGELKSNAILSILSEIGATVDAKAKTELKQRLAGQTFKDTVNVENTAYNIISQINRGSLGAFNIFFDDIGASFTPKGVANTDPPVVYDAELGQIIGTPEPNETGVEFKVHLDNALHLSSRVTLLSKTIQSFFQSGKFIVTTVTHVGSNRADGPFESRVSALFDRGNQVI